MRRPPGVRGSSDVITAPVLHSVRPVGRPESTDELTDLLARLTAGDEHAFARFYDLTSSRVYGMVLRVLRDPAQAAEVTQDVFLEVWQQLGRFDRSKGTPVSWLLMIAHRRAVDRVRSAQSAVARDDRYATVNVDRPYDEVVEQTLSNLEARGVRAAMANLSAPHREALTMAYFGGYTQTEMATLLGIPLGTVKTRVRDALIRMREQIGVPAPA